MIPKRVKYDNIIYYFFRKVKDDMYIYKSKAGYNMCFSNFELNKYAIITKWLLNNKENKKWEVTKVNKITLSKFALSV